MAQHPLYDIQAEQALIGAYLNDPANTVAVGRAVVGALDFYDPLHQMVVDLIYSFEEEGRTISPISLNAWVKHNPAVQEMDGPPGREGIFYLATLASAAPAKPNVAGYAELILDFSMRRKAVEALETATGMISARDGASPQPLMPALEHVVGLADEISEKLHSRTVEIGAAKQGEILLRGIGNQAVSEQQFGMRTNLDDLDRVLGGLFPETLIVAGGRPGMGKSVLGEHLCRQAALQGVPADWWSIEMPSRECTARLMCDQDYDAAIAASLKPLHYEDLVKMRATSGMLERATLANREIHGLDISIFSEDRVTMSRIAAVTRARVARKPGLRLIVIDHLHILMPEDRYKGRRVDELSEITGAAKRLAKRAGSIVVLLAQLSRDIEKREDKHPFMSDFRDSGSIEQDADVVLGLYRGEYYATAALRGSLGDADRTKAEIEYEKTKKTLEIDVLKQRSGETRTTKSFIDIASSAIRSEQPVSPNVAGFSLDNRPK